MAQQYSQATDEFDDDLHDEGASNEVEVLEFLLGDQGFGINVLKISQIIPFSREKFTALPQSQPGMLGTLLWQGHTIPLIDLAGVLHREQSAPAQPIVLITEFSDITNGFLIDGVNKIHRTTWDKLDPVSPILEKYSSRTLGSLHIEDRDILFLDFESIIAEMFPETKLGYYEVKTEAQRGPQRREDVRVVMAEDSAFIRATLKNILDKAGYTQVTEFENGADALRHLTKMQAEAGKSKQPFASLVSLLISDIEMPVMDGLTLCRKVKTELGLKNLPVLIFSSLVSQQMKQRCRDAGAEACITKPQINELVSTMDSLLQVAAPREAVS